LGSLQDRQQLAALPKKLDDAINNKDAAVSAALFAKDAVLVTDTGPVYCSQGIEKYQAEAFQNGHLSNSVTKRDQYGPHWIGTDGKQFWTNGEWSATWQGKTGCPIPVKGYWSAMWF
jgi:ketosteroid isomerase-like protein